jgi:hypothetical protein
MKARAAANGLYGSASDADDSLAAITQDRVPPLSQWAYSQVFTSNAQRADLLPEWLTYYNTIRRHSAPGGQGPDQPAVNNVMSDYN